MDRRIVDKTVDRYLQRTKPAYWALRHKTIKGRPLTFRSKTNGLCHRPWQEEILNDLHSNKIVQKSRQLGMSEVAVTEALWFASQHKNVNIMYTFPTKAQMEDFSKTRVDPVIKNSEYLSKKINPSINSVSTKALGNNNIFMRTAGDGSQGEGADIDMYCADEYDRMKAGIETAFEESLSSSPYGYMRRWSTPTLPGLGVNKLFLDSDQRFYLHKCDKCGHWQEIEYENIVQVKDTIDAVTGEFEDGTYMYICKKCKKELNRWGEGEWVAKYPTRKDTRGYFISQLNAVHISADKVKKKELKYAFKSLFYNYVLGKPFANVALQVTDQDVMSNVYMDRESYNRTPEFVAYVAGIDWGEPAWCVVLGIRANNTIQVVSLKQFYRSETMPLHDVRQVISHLKPFSPQLIIADAGYGADKNTELYRNFPHAAYSCTWRTLTSAYGTVNFIDHWNENTRMVTVDKTSKMQRTLQSVKMGHIGFFNWSHPMTQTIAKHLQNVQILDQEKDGIVYQQATRKGPDHLACCLSYALIGVDRVTQYGLKVSRGYHMETLQV